MEDRFPESESDEEAMDSPARRRPNPPAPDESSQQSVASDVSQATSETSASDEPVGDVDEEPFPYLSSMFKLHPGSTTKNKLGAVNFKLNCLLCPKQSLLLASWRSKSNLKVHVQRKHPGHLNEYEALVKTQGRALSSDGSLKRKRTPSVSKFFAPKGQKRLLTQREFEQKLVKFVVGTGQAFCVVRHPTLVDLLESKYVENKKVPCYDTMMKKLDGSMVVMKEKIRNLLASVQHVCLTADGWSDGHKSFMGVTAHIITENYSRTSPLLAGDLRVLTHSTSLLPC